MVENPLLLVLPADQADLVLIMLVSVPLSFLLSLAYNKHLFLALTMALTIGFQSILFPEDKWILWGQQQVAYLLVVFSPRRHVGRIVVLECFLALICLHARRLLQSYGENNFDITGIFMMQLFNYIGLAYNYQNGDRPEQELTPSQRQRRVVQKPSYITYLGYVNFLPACVVGPVYEYADFDHYLHRTGDYQHIPSTLQPALKEMGTFLIAVLLYGGFSVFPLERVTEPLFTSYSLPYRLLYSVLTIIHITLKYVSVWSLGMVSMRASGFTYNPAKNRKGEDGQVVYDFGRVEANNMTKFYFEPNFKLKVDYWNISIQWALKRYIYENFYDPRAYPDERKRKQAQARAQLYTVLVSALWHGLYPGYFISFVNWVLFIQIANEVYRLKKTENSVVQRFYVRRPLLFDLLESSLSMFAITYFGVTFHLMLWPKIWIFLKATLLLPYILLWLAFLLVVKLGVLGRPQKAPLLLEPTTPTTPLTPSAKLD
jgi:lysophospholipid acyltransferase